MGTWIGKLAAAATISTALVGAPTAQQPTQLETAPRVAVAFQADDGLHTPPVAAPIVDPFRAPEHEFGPGNRSIDYDTEPGVAVVASADGVVSFAGQVAGTLFASIDHGDGLVTTVGLLDDVAVSGGEVVSRGDVLGTAGDTLSFSARQDGVHFDPELLFESFRTVVRLVAAPD